MNVREHSTHFASHVISRMLAFLPYTIIFGAIRPAIKRLMHCTVNLNFWPGIYIGIHGYTNASIFKRRCLQTNPHADSTYGDSAPQLCTISSMRTECLFFVELANEQSSIRRIHSIHTFIQFDGKDCSLNFHLFLCIAWLGLFYYAHFFPSAFGKGTCKWYCMCYVSSCVPNHILADGIRLP